MKTFLVILFLIEGEWSLTREYYPLEMPTLTYCEERRDFADNYLSNVKGLPPYHVMCLETLEEKGGENLDEYIKKNLHTKS